MPFTPEQRKCKFFYAEEEVEKYDVSAELWQPLYSVFHDTAISLLEFHLGVAEVAETRDNDFAFLDLGSGTGAEAIRLLSTFPNARLVTVDLCAPMNSALQRNLLTRFPKEVIESQVTSLEGDVFSDNSNETHWLASLGCQRMAFDAVVSAFMLHHYTAEEKKSLYRRINNVLRPGGIFLNIDLFRYEAPLIDGYANQFTVNWIRRQLTKPEPHLKRFFDGLGPGQEKLRDKWLKHCEEQNIPLVFSVDGTKKTPGVTPTETELLQEAGFSKTECPMRFWSTGIAVAIK